MKNVTNYSVITLTFLNSKKDPKMHNIHVLLWLLCKLSNFAKGKQGKCATIKVWYSELSHEQHHATMKLQTIDSAFSGHSLLNLTVCFIIVSTARLATSPRHTLLWANAQSRALNSISEIWSCLLSVIKANNSVTNVQLNYGLLYRLRF